MNTELEKAAMFSAMERALPNPNFTEATKQEYFTSNLMRASYINGWQDALNWREQQGWVSVKNRLPEIGYGPVLTCDNMGFFEVAEWINFNWYTHTERLELVTHWRPLPAAPKEDGV